MTIPGFSGAASLYRTTTHYRLSTIAGTQPGVTVLEPPVMVPGPPTCNSAVLNGCLADAAAAYTNCRFACANVCSVQEMMSGTCTSPACCECMQPRDCQAERALAEATCQQLFGCPAGLQCTEDINSPGSDLCCSLGEVACAGQCAVAVCIAPKYFDRLACGCVCPPTVCTPPHVFSPTTCQCKCPTTICTGGKVLDPATCQCVCPPGLTDCAGICRNLLTDRYNCGTCGNVCPTGQACCNGVCVTLDTTTNCGICGRTCAAGEGCCNRVCRSLNTSLNCGSCGNVCTGGKQCQNGACVCPTGLTDCAGVCKNLKTDPQNCGSCGNVCTGGKQCQNGACVCPPGLTDCLGVCRNLLTDPQNCGACGANCQGGACQNGVCLCPAGTTTCATGCCPAGTVCSFGQQGTPQWGCCPAGAPKSCPPTPQNPAPIGYCCPQNLNCCAAGCCLPAPRRNEAPDSSGVSSRPDHLTSPLTV